MVGSSGIAWQLIRWRIRFGSGPGWTGLNRCVLAIACGFVKRPSVRGAGCRQLDRGSRLVRVLTPPRTF